MVEQLHYSVGRRGWPPHRSSPPWGVEVIEEALAQLTALSMSIESGELQGDCRIDRGLTGRIFISLLLDRRGRRKGFPAPVAYELMRLRALLATNHDIGTKLWETRSLATSDRVSHSETIQFASTPRW